MYVNVTTGYSSDSRLLWQTKSTSSEAENGTNYADLEPTNSQVGQKRDTYFQLKFLAHF